MKTRLLISLLLVTTSSIIYAQQTQLVVRTSAPAWINVDQRQRGMTGGGTTPLQIPVTPGSHSVTAEALQGGSTQGVEVEATANATTVVLIQLGGAGTPNVSPLDSSTDAQQQRQGAPQSPFEKQQRESQIRQLEGELTNLQKQMAQAQQTKDEADQALQDCQTQSQDKGIAMWLKATKCTLGRINSNNAQKQIRELQVLIASKQRELQRLDRQNVN